MAIANASDICAFIGLGGETNEMQEIHFDTLKVSNQSCGLFRLTLYR